MDQFNWDDLRIFLAYTRHGGMRACASHLGISHSTVARRLELMQQKAGIRFLERSDRGFVLSAAGGDFLKSAERIEAEILNLERRNFGREQALGGPIVLTTIDALCIPPILRLLAEFRQQHPAVDLILDVNESVANLDRREADLALRFAASPADHLIGQRVFETGRAIYVSRKYHERHWPNPEETGAGWISFALDQKSDTWIHETPYPSLPATLRIEDMRTQLTACREGLGIAYLPCFLCAGHEDLIRLTEPDFPRFQTLWLLRHPDTKDNQRTTVLSGFLLKRMKEMGAVLQRGSISPD